MKGKGPIFTLIGGLVLAAVLVALSSVAVKRDSDKQKAASNVAAAPAASASASAVPKDAPAPTQSASTTPAAPPAAEAPVNYAGRVDGNAAALAISVKDGKAIAYLCNGKTLESWLQGTAVGGKLELAGLKDGALTGTYGNGQATGTVSSGGKQWTFTIQVATPPGGLYRLSTLVDGAKVVAGWVRLKDGTLVGMVDFGNGREQEAPPIVNGQVSINGTTQTPRAVDPSAPLS